MFKHQFIVSIEGNIGSGKSTLLSNLQKEFENNKTVVFLKEPVDEWETIKDTNGNTMLKKFYHDQDKYSFSFQMMAYISRLANLKKAIELNREATIFITERSLFTDKCVFAKMLFESGKIEDVNFQIYMKWFDTFVEDFPISKVIYVRTNPEICYQRISKRNRLGEDSIPLEYLSNCHKYHENMINHNLILKSKNIILDGNVDIYRNENKLIEWINTIKNFLYN